MISKNWNLKDFYNSNNEFLKDFEKVKKGVSKLEKFKGKLCLPNKDVILEYFKLDTEISIILEKLAVYAYCKNDDDGKNEENIKNYQTLNDYFVSTNKKLAFAKTELSKLDDKFLLEVAKDPDFSDFDITLKDIIRCKPHTLSEKEETQMAAVSATQNSDDVYSVLCDIEMDHGSYVDENGKEIKLTTGNINSLMKNPKQSERQKIQEAYLAEYKRLNLTLSNLYISHLKYMNYVAETYHYNSVLDMLTFGEEVSPKVMMKNIDYVSGKSKLLQKYFDLKKKILGLDKFYTSDIFSDLAQCKANNNMSYEDAVSDIKETFKLLGDDYVQKFTEATENGWIDAFPRENKASGGYTISTYAVHPFILLNFDGTAYWKSAIAHEFGHAMHSYYSANAQPYDKHDYTIFVAEVASLTNELLLEHHLLEKTTDKKEKMQLLSDFLQLFYLNVYNSSMLAEFELFAHTKLDAGETLTGSDLNNKYVELCKKYFGKSVELVKGFETDWSRKSHIFSDYYLYKYSTGLITACCIAQKIIGDKSGEYIKKYKKFLSLGGSLDPVSSLKVAEIDILGDEPYKFAFKMFEDYLNELENLFKEDL